MASRAKKTAAKKSISSPDSAPLTCGLVMPISTIDGCSADHWVEVKGIISEAVEMISEPKFVVRLVSEADDVGVIQKRIVQNIYNSDLVVCDVSGRNANVMFELGMRLAFDKPIVIVKDDKTDYSFDTSIIEHLSYPRDLRFSRIVEFKAALAMKVANTYKASRQPDHSPFLKNFGKFNVVSLTETEVPADQLIIDSIDELRREMAGMRRRLASDISRHTIRRTEGEMRIMRELAMILSDSKLRSPMAVLGNPKLVMQIEERIDAARYFSDPDEFRKVLKEKLMELELSRER